MTMRLPLVLLAFAFWAPDAMGVADDLQCFKVTNQTLKSLKAVVDLDTPDVGLAPGCKLGKAKLYCLPSSMTVRPGTLFDGSKPVNGLPVEGPPAETARICYEVKCKAPVGTAPDQFPFDELGEHRFGKLATSMVCTSASVDGVVPTGFQINSPTITVPPGQEQSYCYAFRTPNNHQTAIKAWASEMVNVERMVMIFTQTDQKPLGNTVDPGLRTALVRWSG